MSDEPIQLEGVVIAMSVRQANHRSAPNTYGQHDVVITVQIALSYDNPEDKRAEVDAIRARISKTPQAFLSV